MMMTMMVDEDLNSLFSYSYRVSRRAHISENFTISISTINK